MKNFLITLKTYSQTSYRVLLFLIAVFLISNLMPREGKFRYEFKKGEPWGYDVLIAPFNFRIYKTAEELSHEKDSILKNFRPYFIRDLGKSQEVYKGFSSLYDNAYGDYKLKYPFLTKKIEKDYITTKVESLLNLVYKKGIIGLTEEFIDKKDEMELMLVDKNLATPYSASEFYTLRSAYKYVTLELSKDFSSYIKNTKEVESFISELPLGAVLEINVSIDNYRTQKEKNSQLENLVLTNGIVLAGQKVIAKGELIDDLAQKKLNSYKKEYELRVGTLSEYNITYGGHILITLLYAIGLFLFLFFYRKDVFYNLKYITFLLLILCTVVALAYLSYRIQDIPMWVIPFTILPLIVRTFMDSRLGFFVYVVSIILSSLFSNNSFEFIFLQIPAGITAIFSLYKMVRRAQIVRSAIFIFLTYSLFYTGLALLQEGDLSSVDYQYYMYFAINGLLIFIVYPLIYIFEKLFGFISDVTLVELSDTNHPLLRKLAENAPGTFQHSIQVGNLAQEAAYKIEANPLLVRAGAMYHDIGKSTSPIYFTENQTSGVNPHNELDFEESAKMVIDHIEGGVKIAKKYNLPQIIIDFISTHQGTTKTKFFYNSFINKYPDREPIDQDFTYPGPTPFTKETAILMMADSIEAASRSLKEYTDEAINKLVENIINNQIKEKQFDNAPITFKEITEVKEVFKTKLKNIYHARVAYPEAKKRSSKKSLD